MSFSSLSQFSSVGTALILFLLMIAFYWAGFKLSLRHKKKEPSEGFGPVEGPLLGLLALFLAFTFSMAASRYDTRRQVLIEEANVIGTAILRADLYPDTERKLFRADFKDYLEARIAFYETGFDEGKIKATTGQSGNISAKLWTRAALLAQNRDNLISSNQMIPALNAMIDIVTTRNAARFATVPDSIVWLLFVLCLVSSFVVGYSRKETESSWVVIIVFALMVSAAVFITLDLDRPSQGLITLEEANKNIIELRSLFENEQ
jgi:membrane protease YdiL (CAAX protease family)